MPGRVRQTLKLGLSTPRSSTSSLDGESEHHSTMKNLRRSIEMAGAERRGSKAGAKQTAPAQFDMEMESPPLVLYGPAETSTGAILSGQLKVVVNESQIRLDEIQLELLATVKTKKPVHSHCSDCSTKVNSLHKWQLLTEPVTLSHGTHSYPFSHLIAGHLPATSHGVLAHIDYKLVAHAQPHGGQEMRYERALDVKRAISPGAEKSSVRIFPPTTLTATVVVQPVIHPIGSFPIQFRLDGVTKRGLETQTHWRMRKLNWRIDEKSKMVSPACAKHSHKVGGEGKGKGKGVFHEDLRTIGSRELRSGWKTDFSAGSGQIELEFLADISPASKPVCDVDSATGMVVAHNLVVELVVAEEYCYNKTPRLVTPTGAARILRMSFNVIVTERGGMGISWDEEQPPVYGDVPASPPTYTQMEDIDGSTLDGEDMDRLQLS
ncbi:MAG: hypothetical protein M1825_003432 [Sarcosagium campestre]|nr:MAG: hypothetical protein M1825_003432 [Sarcosagium campestre]